MSKQNWKTAPEDAEFYSGGRFRKHVGVVEFAWIKNGWEQVTIAPLTCHKAAYTDFEVRPQQKQPIKSGDMIVHLPSGNEYFYVGRTKCGSHAMQDSVSALVQFNNINHFELAKSDRQKWIEQAALIIMADPLELDPLGYLYDALKDSKLPKP